MSVQKVIKFLWYTLQALLVVFSCATVLYLFVWFVTLHQPSLDIFTWSDGERFMFAIYFFFTPPLSALVRLQNK